MATPGVHIYLDNSNVFLSAKNIARDFEGINAKQQVRLQFSNVVDLALAGRPYASATVVGSVPPGEREVWDRLAQATGVQPELYERGSLSGTEQGVDQCLQVHMLRAIEDYKQPQIAVLMTGDGAGYDDGVGFHADLERMHAAGWAIEVISWRKSCKRTLREWATQVGVFIALDDYYDQVTFLEGHRVVKPLDLSKRALASPRKSPAELAEERIRAEYEAKLGAVTKQLEQMQAAAAEKEAKKARYERRFNRGPR
jgi:hypothetical protein